MEFAIETNDLSKYYREVHAVSSVNLRVKRGEIYGFLGLNGAGKTTTIRALLGMIRPSIGSVKVLDQLVGPHGRGPWARVGHLVENPSAYPELTVFENLEISRRFHKIRDSRITFQIMEKLNITQYAKRKAATLSTGNLQRLGLARSLLHEPELLILDEPANGLDPVGVVEIRELLRALVHERGITVFMSSHILTEVDRLATRIGIIHKGCLIEELDSTRLELLRARHLLVKTRNASTAMKVLEKGGYTATADHDGSLRIKSARAVEHPEDIANILVQGGCGLTHLAVEQEDLEEHFLRLTQN